MEIDQKVALSSCFSQNFWDKQFSAFISWNETKLYLHDTYSMIWYWYNLHGRNTIRGDAIQFLFISIQRIKKCFYKNSTLTVFDDLDTLWEKNCEHDFTIFWKMSVYMWRKFWCKYNSRTNAQNFIEILHLVAPWLQWCLLNFDENHSKGCSVEPFFHNFFVNQIKAPIARNSIKF